jgi:hypothetical protein
MTCSLARIGIVAYHQEKLGDKKLSDKSRDEDRRETAV